MFLIVQLNISQLTDLHIVYVFMDSVLLYSSTDYKTELGDDSFADANTYLPFKIVDTAVTTRIGEELDAMTELEEEGKISSYFKPLRYTNIQVLW